MENHSGAAHPVSLPVVTPEQWPSLSSDERARIAAELVRLDVGEVRFDAHNRSLYSTDASLYQVEPVGVVIPKDIASIERLVSWCASRHMPLLPRGGGTSLAGQCSARAIVVDLTPCCRRVLDIDVAAKRCRVEPGIGIDELNRRLAVENAGLFFAADPATSAQAAIGGCIGNNAAGARSIRYGRTSENLAAVDVVLTTGQRVTLEAGAGRKSPIALALARQVAAVVSENADEIRQRFPRLKRRNAGYGLDLILQQIDAGVLADDLDLSGLICGSEGTLAVVVGATLKLHPLPVMRGLALISFATLDAAMEAVVPIIATAPSAVELLDEVVIRAAAENSECRHYLSLFPPINGQTPPAVLYVEYQVEPGGHDLRTAFAALREVVGAAPIAELHDAPSMTRAWTLRKASEALLHAIPGNAKPVTFVEDNSVPVENLRGFVKEFRQIVERHGAEAAYYAHASVGVLHVRPLLDLHVPAGRQAMQDIAIEVADLARRCGGVMSGEHGDGKVRGPLLADFYGPRIMAAFRRIKTIFDPAGILNPGNIVDAGPVASITRNFRLDAENNAIDLAKVDTFFDYGREGFAGAVEMCNGAGFCRKTAGGAMCPSYRATLDERHSTRGRANAIRLAVTGQFAEARDGAEAQPNWNDAGVNETLDLCLSCKACKTECPSNVDVAQLKAEYLAQQHRAGGGPPLATRVFGNVRLLNRIGSLTPGLANWVNRLPVTRWLLGRVLGFAPKRSVPAFAPSLYRWFARREKPQPARPRVALFADCFAAYNEPHIGKAATAVLEAMGFAVELPISGCCARPMISNGLLADAIATADRTLADLARCIDDPAVTAIIVLEPSCLSAIQDDWLKLKLKTDRRVRERLAQKAMLLEQFVEREWERRPPTLTPAGQSRAKSSHVVLHGHCHQKALWGVESSAAALRRVCRTRVDVLPSGCCGMAGAFGYTADHYHLSMKIGELSVFPPVRAASDDAVIVAPGASCRHQIHDGTGRAAIHPAEFLASVLAPDRHDK